MFRTPRALQALSVAGLFLLGAHGVAAAEIVRWVDAEGVTQFTDPQLAAAPATVVQVQAANGMDVPTGAPESRTRGPVFTKIAMSPKKNKRGWQGYSTSRKRNPRRGRR